MNRSMRCGRCKTVDKSLTAHKSYSDIPRRYTEIDDILMIELCYICAHDMTGLFIVYFQIRYIIMTLAGKYNRHR